MNLTRRNIIFISICLGLSGLFYFYYKYIYKAPVHWEESFEEERTDPYGTFILFQLLNGISAKEGVKKLDNPVNQFLKRQTGSGHANYVFVGNMLIFDSTDAQSLYDFAEKGNDVFIAANSFPDELNKKLFEPSIQQVYRDNDNYQDTIVAPLDEGQFSDTTGFENDINSLKTTEDSTLNSEEEENQKINNEYTEDVSADTSTLTSDTNIIDSTFYYPIVLNQEDSIVQFRFAHKLYHHKVYAFQYFNEFKPRRYSWNYLNDSVRVLNGVSKKTLADIGKDRPVFYRFKVGKGHIYYHSLPLTFTNLYLKQRAVLEYTNNVFSYLKPGVVYWDNFHKSYHDNNNSGGLSGTPLKYILSQPSLAWAWYMSLAGVVLYMLFFAKRKQKVIPLLEPNTNTSIEFVETLSLMYLKSSFAKIAEVKAKNLRIFIWERYKISSDLPLDEYAEKVSVFSGIEKPKILLIFVLLKNLQYDYASKEEFLEYHGLIEFFHKNCK